MLGIINNNSRYFVPDIRPLRPRNNPPGDQGNQSWCAEWNRRWESRSLLDRAEPNPDAVAESAFASDAWTTTTTTPGSSSLGRGVVSLFA